MYWRFGFLFLICCVSRLYGWLFIIKFGHYLFWNYSVSFPSLLSDNIPQVTIQLLSCLGLFATPWTAACQASCLSFTVWQNLLKLMSVESVMPSNYLILCCPYSSCPQTFPASGLLTVSRLFVSSGQSIWASALASVLPMNIQDWFPSGLTGLISLLFKGPSRFFSNTTNLKHQFFGAQLSL